ncbi:MAG: glycosyltransferase family 4 protein [Polyangiaceae bacterium]|nr:glycosyltransferase family 4 protein [Polyangiaceae bacterium]
MLNVAHVLRKFDSDQWGGTETHVVEISRRLTALGSGQTIHAPLGPTGNGPPGVPVMRYRAFCPFLGSPESIRKLYSRGGNIASFDEAACLFRDRSISLAHTHTLGRIGGAVRSAMRWSGRPYVVSVHGPLLAAREYVRSDTHELLRDVWDLGRPVGALFGARRVLSDANRVICFNDAELNALQQRVGRRAVRMDHGVDHKRWSSGSLERAKLRWPQFGPHPVVTLVGRFSKQKNQLLAVRAFALGAPPEYRLVFAGGIGEPRYRDQVIREARSLGIAGRVHVLSNVEPGDMPDLYARTQFCILPSRHEAFGLVVLEAWAAGTPVVFSRAGGLNDLGALLRDDTATVKADDPETWGAVMALLCQDGLRRRRLAKEGGEWVSKRFDWEVISRQLQRLYEDVVEEVSSAA